MTKPNPDAAFYRRSKTIAAVVRDPYVELVGAVIWRHLEDLQSEDPQLAAEARAWFRTLDFAELVEAAGGTAGAVLREIAKRATNV